MWHRCIYNDIKEMEDEPLKGLNSIYQRIVRTPFAYTFRFTCSVEQTVLQLLIHEIIHANLLSRE
jgi:hypothetical protein